MKFIKNNAPVIISLMVLLILVLVPTGFEDAIIDQGADRTRGKVVSVNNELIVDTGLIKSGEQNCTVELLGGKFQGKTVAGFNMLNGSLENDKIFAPGDTALVVIHYQGEEIRSVNLIDHYRLPMELILAVMFALFLILVAGATGVRAILSFAITILMLWKVLVPSYLNGYNPVYVGMVITAFLTILIISLVFGFDRRTLSAVCGSITGLLVTAVLGIVFTQQFKIHGAIMPYSESLLYSGYAHLNLTQIFMASIFIGSSGAVMDLAVDITSAVNEVVEKKPDIGVKEAIKSGMNVGRAAMGTMTTTLLLAYSGGYLASLMVFMAQGTPIGNILNYKYVSAEILDTMVGSFGLVSVAPLTAICAGFFLTKKEEL